MKTGKLDISRKRLVDKVKKGRRSKKEKRKGESMVDLIGTPEGMGAALGFQSEMSGELGE